MYRSSSPGKPNRTQGHKRNPTSNSYQQFSPTPTTPIRNPTFDQLPQSYSANREDLEHIHVSPTKALALSRLQHDISQLQTWLESLFYPARVPAYLLKWRDEVLTASSATVDGVLINNGDQIGDRAEGTVPGAGVGGNQVLETLKTLKQANLGADHLNSLVHEAELEALARIEERQSVLIEQRSKSLPARKMVDELCGASHRQAEGSLRELSHSVGTLGVELHAPTVESISLEDQYTNKLLTLAYQRLALDQQIHELDMLTRTINAKAQIKYHGGQNFGEEGIDQETIESYHTQSTQFNRDTKQINLKIMEYEDRARGLQKQLANVKKSSSSLEDVLLARRRMQQRKTKIKELQDKIASFQGLPPDLEASRAEIRRAMAELENLKKKREGLFEKMGTG